MTTSIDKRVAKYAAALNILAPYLEPEFPSMRNRTPGSIVDDIGPINELMKDCEKVKKTLQGIVDSKMTPTDDGVINGENYQMKIVPVSQRKLDQGKAKEILERLGVDPDEYMYDLDMQQHRYKAL